MLYRIVVRDMSARIFNVAKGEALARGEHLSCTHFFKGVQILSLEVTNDQQVANVLSTLQTDSHLVVLEVGEEGSVSDMPARRREEHMENPFDSPKLELIA